MPCKGLGFPTTVCSKKEITEALQVNGSIVNVSMTLGSKA